MTPFNKSLSKHDKRDAHQKNQDSLPANFINHVFSGGKFVFFLTPLPQRTQRLYFGTCRHSGTATFSCSATLKDNLFNFTAQSVFAILGEVGTSIAHRVVTKKQGRSNSRVKLRFRSLWHLLQLINSKVMAICG